MTSTLSLKRLGRTMGAQTYSQLVTIGVQLASVPLLIAFWGTARYGGWLVLAAIPTYLTLSDFGFTFIAKNEMVMRIVTGHRDKALITYHSVFALLTAVALILIPLLGLTIFLTPIADIFSLGPVTQSEGRIVLFLLVLNVIATQFFLLLCAGVRTAGRPAAEVMWAATAKLLESIAIVLAAAFSSEVATAAICALCARLACMTMLTIWLSRVAPQLPLSFARASRKEIQRLFAPSLSYMLVSLSHALMIQGPVVVLGMVANTTAVVVFSTTRTMTRMGTSAANLINFSFSPEYSRLWGAQDWRGFRRLERIHLVVGAVGIALYFAGLTLLGGWLMHLWTHGVVTVTEPFFGLVMAAVVAEMIWGALFTPMAAINRHMSSSHLYGVLSVIGIVVCYPLAAWGGMNAAGAMLVCVHGLMVVYMVLWANPFRLQEAYQTGENLSTVPGT